MAGESLIFLEQRARSIRPCNSEKNQYLQPMTEEIGGQEVGGGNGGDNMEESDEQAGQWDAIAGRGDDLTKRVAEYLDDDNAPETHHLL